MIISSASVIIGFGVTVSHTTHTAEELADTLPDYVSLGLLL